MLLVSTWFVTLNGPNLISSPKTFVVGEDMLTFSARVDENNLAAPSLSSGIPNASTLKTDSWNVGLDVRRSFKTETGRLEVDDADEMG